MVTWINKGGGVLDQIKTWCLGLILGVLDQWKTLCLGGVLDQCIRHTWCLETIYDVVSWNNIRRGVL